MKEFNLSRRQDYGQTKSTHDLMKPGASVDMYFVKCLIDCRGQKVETVEPTCTWTLCSELRCIRIANGKAWAENAMLQELFGESDANEFEMLGQQLTLCRASVVRIIGRS